jgi:hypothetical protein|tara:strand:- start:1401 stop:2495 length:1095 start_codon:yes stop_codon:yes gene_type:complete
MLKSLVILLLGFFSVFLHGNNLSEILIQIGPKGEGNVNAVNHWHTIKQMSSSEIPKLLEAMNKANELGDNWIRAAIAEILANSGEESLPAEEIVKFIKNQLNEGSSRRTAFDLLNSTSSQLAQSLVPMFIDDPEPTMRREGVKLLLEQAGSLEKKQQSIEAFEYALSKARDVDQIEEACASLETLGKKVDLPKVMGFLTDWNVIGPFENKGRRGFGTPYSPEKQDKPILNDHPGKNGPVKWQQFSTNDRLGLLDLNQPFGHIKEVLCYAYTEFESSSEKNAQFRIGSKNAWKLWINNKLVFARDEYHRGGTKVDQFVLNGQLRKGRNQILVKICQNEQTESWTKQWEFCFRITDESGTSLNSLK